MKHCTALFLILLLVAVPLFAEDIPLGATVNIPDIFIVDATNTMASPDADGPLRCDVRKNTSDTPLSISGLATAMVGLTTTGGFRFSAALTSGNGFAVADNVNVNCFAKVGGITQPVAKAAYRIVATEATAGYPKVDVGLINNVSTTAVTNVNAHLGTTQPINFTGTGASALTKSDIIDIASAAVNTALAQLGVNVVSMANNSLTAAATAADTGTELGTAVWATPTRQLTGTQAFNLTGDITGNVSGSVGSVTGNVGGNVGGTINGLTATALADLFDTNSGTTYGAAAAGSVVKEIVDNAAGSMLTEAGIADAVWDEATAGHATAGSTGKALTDASSAGDPWSTALPGAYVAGSAGKIIGSILFDAATTVGTINTTANSISGRIPAALTADGNIKADTLRVSGTTQTAGDIVATINLLQVLPKGVAFPNYPVFIRRTGTVATGVTGATVSCQAAISNGAGYSSFSGTGISNVLEVGNGYYSIDLDATIIGNATIIRCTATGGTGTADPFIQTIFGQR